MELKEKKNKIYLKKKKKKKLQDIQSGTSRIHLSNNR